MHASEYVNWFVYIIQIDSFIGCIALFLCLLSLDISQGAVCFERNKIFIA